MPELVPTYDRLVDLAGGGDLAARLLSLWRPPGFIVGCSQGAWTRGEPLLVRNYDYPADRLEGVVCLTQWGERRVIGMSDCLWGLLDGMNDRGLPISLTFGGRPDVGDGFAIPLVVRYVLETCDDVAAAREALARIPVHAPQNLTLLDSSGAYRDRLRRPGRPARFVDLAATTNHQGEVEWPEYAAAIRSEEREQCVLDLLGDPELDRERFEDAFLEPPLHSTAHERGFGTIYTAAYEPGRGRVRYRWPDVIWEQSFERFEPGTPDRQAVLNASAPAGTGSCGGGLRAGELRLHAGDPLARPLGQLVVLGLHPRARDQHAEVGARVAVVAGREHAQEERLGLVVQAVPVVAPAGELDAAGVLEPPDPRLRRLRELLDLVAGVLEDDLAPDVDARSLRPSGG